MLLAASGAAGARDSPLASCKGWNATLNQRSGIDSRRATMTGTVTEANLAEYCRRDPGGETVQYGGDLTVKAYIAKYRQQVGHAFYRAVADCTKGSLSFFPPQGDPQTVLFPLAEDADTSCASGMPPLMAQFKLLCPKAAARYHIE
ncbi:hypothetical protein BTR14_02380 [Rhizobium rhizosphaerae]|uniref:Uncharacterized protein n=2 Tax=Xaviernesmea rhizosphaerae TaxID=1672749 RepID=A0ABX3PJF8_9HYPH|nr:hypothetical protein BTR14_02380 [Xaviernesmea rhizosphaerae]